MTVRFNPRDAGEIRVYFDDAFLCRAIAPELASESVSLSELQGVRAKRRRELKQQLRQRRSLADALPGDTRYLPIDTEEAEAGEAEPVLPSQPAPRKGLRLYATD